ncbi:MAG: anthranilate synthase component I family protein [Nannocystaceae bacterium]|nr:anthranilate synthase component I family protein [Nannocystaceae bacterium]
MAVSHEPATALLADPTRRAAAALACAAASTGGFAWLDGGDDGRGMIGLQPELELVGDSLALFDTAEALWRQEPSVPWVGVISYDFAADLVLGRTPRPRRLPGVVLRRYRDAWTWGPDAPPQPREPTAALQPLLDAARDPMPAAPPWPLQPPQALWSAEHYRAQVHAAQRAIVAGDTYQVNLAQRFVAPWLQPPTQLAPAVAAIYGALRRRAPAERGALIQLHDAWVVSNSPETLLDVDEDDAGIRHAVSRPIKGTRPRERDAAADRAQLEALWRSEKDRAEHVMIVDLVRNDLGRLARPGTVRAPASPTSLSLPTVHHLVSEVHAQLREGVTLAQLVVAMVPGGSVTGAPKRRTIEIIEALEQVPRGVYCGAILWLSQQRLRMSIPIRTGLVDAQGLQLHAGGGIVLDSEAEAERLETWAKLRAFAPP